MISVSDLIPEDLLLNKEEYNSIKVPKFYLKSKILFCDVTWNIVEKKDATHIIIATRTTEMRIGHQKDGVICEHIIYGDDGSIHEIKYGFNGKIVKITKGGF